ncbi:hypothetical protein [Sphingomonas mollis]|uniref:Anti-sigma factor NepR domain-containing protein n=1 Tax=Sphingomonas mollis TaxID=2795726 RepID=A0ABS0XKV6_9SPHN|nr:hypothetical protein [Sphingomonas sp. BT553]MBJ6120659.1 hypothetical protein [Sphingomonas sp. BT553]
MSWSTSLVIERDGGEQFVRRPRDYDAIGGALRNAYTAADLPADMIELLRRMDGPASRHH